MDRAKVSHIQREPSGQFSDLETWRRCVTLVYERKLPDPPNCYTNVLYCNHPYILETTAQTFQPLEDKDSYWSLVLSHVEILKGEFLAMISADNISIHPHITSLNEHYKITVSLIMQAINLKSYWNTLWWSKLCCYKTMERNFRRWKLQAENSDRETCKATVSCILFCLSRKYTTCKETWTCEYFS